MTSPSQKIEIKKPINIARKTRIERSLFFMTLISPIRKASTPEVPASSIGIVSTRLLKNVSPPRCPEATRSRNTTRSTTKATTNPVDFSSAMVQNWENTRVLVIRAAVKGK